MAGAAHGAPVAGMRTLAAELMGSDSGIAGTSRSTSAVRFGALRGHTFLGRRGARGSRR